MTAPRFLPVTMTDLGHVREYRDAFGTLVARVSAWCVTDYRHAPPFLAMSPCPYCDANEDRGHIALRHVDPRFGRNTR